MPSAPIVPLLWPANQPRRDAFKRENSGTTYGMSSALAAIYAALKEAFGQEIATTMRLSTNWSPIKPTSRPSDPAFVVYVTHNQQWLAFACDRFRRPEQNAGAVAKLIEALSTYIQLASANVPLAIIGAFYSPHPPPEILFRRKPPRPSPHPQDINWQKLFNNPTSIDALKKAFRLAAKDAHPDLGGSTEQFIALQTAYAMAEAALKANGSYV